MGIWDSALNHMLWTMLDPDGFRYVIEKWIGMGIHDHKTYDFLSGQGVGQWYSFNDLMLYRAIQAQLAYRGATFLNATLTGPPSHLTTREVLYQISTYWRNLVND